MYGALSTGVVLTSAPALQQLSPTVTQSPSHQIEAVAQQSIETPINLADADGSSNGGDRRGAGRR